MTGPPRPLPIPFLNPVMPFWDPAADHYSPRQRSQGWNYPMNRVRDTGDTTSRCYRTMQWPTPSWPKYWPHQ